jgi:hypothetical protein
MEWVLLVYRLPREPSTPRIGLWRQLRRLGAAQIADGVVALPLNPTTREQLEWLADDILDHGGEASIWLAQPGSAGHRRSLVKSMTEAAAREYQRVIEQAGNAPSEPMRRRTLARLRRELRRIAARDYFPNPMQARARGAVEALSQSAEAAS